MEHITSKAMKDEELKQQQLITGGIHIEHVDQYNTGNGVFYQTNNYYGSRKEETEHEAPPENEEDNSSEVGDAPADNDEPPQIVDERDRIKYAVNVAFSDPSHTKKHYKGDMGLIWFGLEKQGYNLPSYSKFKEFMVEMGFDAEVIPGRTTAVLFHRRVDGDLPKLEFGKDVDSNEQTRITHLLVRFNNAYKNYTI